MNIKPITQKATGLLSVSTLLLSFTSQAALLARDLDGNLATAEAYYSTDQDITWLADANYAETSGYDDDGQMTWADANAWAATLNFDGVAGWRLPDTVDVGNDGTTYTNTNFYEGVDAGFNITTHSEMSYMYYEILGNLASTTISGVGICGNCLTNTGPFSNIQAYDYWSATEYVNLITEAWYFNFADGSQYVDLKGPLGVYAWAVHTGDVGAAVVPVPAAAWLFLSAIGGLFGLKYRARSGVITNLVTRY